MEENNQQTPQQVNQPLQTPVENPVPVKLEEKPKKNSGLTVILSFTTIIATLIAGFFYFQNTQLRTELQKNLPKPEATQINEDIKNTFLYENSDLGFSLELPNSWKDKYQTTNIYFDNSQDISAVNFEYLPIDKESSNYKIFSIERMILEDWDIEIQITSRPHISEEKKILSSGEYVFYYTISLDNPYLDEDANIYQDMSSSIKSIIDSIKLIDIDGVEEIPSITTAELEQGWYWGSSTQKKEGTPVDWVFCGNENQNDKWQEPNLECEI